MSIILSLSSSPYYLLRFLTCCPFSLSDEMNFMALLHFIPPPGDCCGHLASDRLLVITPVSWACVCSKLIRRFLASDRLAAIAPVPVRLTQGADVSTTMCIVKCIRVGEQWFHLSKRKSVVAAFVQFFNNLRQDESKFFNWFTISMVKCNELLIKVHKKF